MTNGCLTLFDRIYQTVVNILWRINTSERQRHHSQLLRGQNDRLSFTTSMIHCSLIKPPQIQRESPSLQKRRPTLFLHMGFWLCVSFCSCVLKLIFKYIVLYFHLPFRLVRQTHTSPWRQAHTVIAVLTASDVLFRKPA